MLPMLEEDSACLNPQAYKPDKFVNSKKNSLENAPERDAFLIVISTLINENQCLKAENNLLRNKILMQQLNPTGQAKQELPCSSDEYKLEKAQQERSRRRSNDTVQFSRSIVSPFKLKMCKYCRQVHRYGLSSCEAYGAVCSYCQQANHFEEACYFKYPHLRKFKRNRTRNGSKSSESRSRIKRIEISRIKADESKSNESLKTNKFFKQRSCSIPHANHNDDKTLNKGRLQNGLTGISYSIAVKSVRSVSSEDGLESGALSDRKSNEADRNSQKTYQNMKQKKIESREGKRMHPNSKRERGGCKGMRTVLL